MLQEKILNATNSCSKKLKTFNDSIKLLVNNNISDFIKGFIKNTSQSSHTNTPYTGVYHRIDVGGHVPSFAKARRLSEEKTVSNEGIFKNAKQGENTYFHSEWDRLLKVVKKLVGNFKYCGDYYILSSTATSNK